MVYLNLSSLARVPGSWFKKGCDPDPSRIEKIINLHVDTTWKNTSQKLHKFDPRRDLGGGWSPVDGGT